MQCPEVVYKGFALTPVVAPDDGMYTAMLIVREPAGNQRATGMLGEFPCPQEARRFAFLYGMAEIDHQKTPEPDWTEKEGHNRKRAQVESLWDQALV
jgi:hypothetical protein